MSAGHHSALNIYYLFSPSDDCHRQALLAEITLARAVIREHARIQKLSDPLPRLNTVKGVGGEGKFSVYRWMCLNNVCINVASALNQAR
jgi:hypothetical protein